MQTLIGDDVNYAASLLSDDDVVAIPTETVYGLAANALSVPAVTKIYTVKQRPFTNPLIVHISSNEEIDHFAENIPADAYTLATHFWPGSLTLILPKKGLISGIVTANQPTIALRVPNHPLTLQLLSSLSFPIAAPSANPFNYISPTKAEHVKMQLDGLIPYILDGGPCNAGIESTIIGFSAGEPIIYRPGAIAKEEIESYLNKKIQASASQDNTTTTPGMFKKHYSPKTPLILLEKIPGTLTELTTKNTGIISLRTKYESIAPGKQVVLSTTGNLTEAARNLYDAMIYLDRQKLDLIIVEKMPATGLGIAINDRLIKAANNN